MNEHFFYSQVSIEEVIAHEDFVKNLLTPRDFCRLSFSKFQHSTEEWKEESLKIVTDALICQKGNTDKQDRKLFFVPSGMGGGKSRVLSELRTIIEPELRDDVALIELRVNFENGTSILPSEHSSNNRSAVVAKALLDRIMYHLIGGGGVVHFEDFRKKRKWDFCLTTLLEAIQVEMRAKLKKNAVIVLVSVDGGHHMDQKGARYIDKRVYEERQGWYDDSALRAMFGELRGALVSVQYVMCAVSSTVTLPILRTIEGSHTIYKAVLHPPRLTQLPEEITNNTVVEHGPYFVDLFGEHPRTMEFLLEVEKESISEIMDYCAEQLRIRYHEFVATLSANELNDLLRYSLSATCTKTSPVGEKIVDDVMSLGLLTLSDATLRISPVLLYALWRGSGAEFPILKDWQPFTNDTDARGFERFNGYVQCVRSKVFRGEVPLTEFLHGVRWCSTPSQTVTPVPLEFVQAKHQLHTASEWKGRVISDGLSKNSAANPGESTLVVGKNKTICLRGHCVMNADQASAGDLFFPLTKGTETVHVVTQAKHSQSDVGDVTLSNSQANKNAKIAASKGDVYLLVTKKRLQNDALTELSKEVSSGVCAGVVDAHNFASYFGPFSSNFPPATRKRKREEAPVRKEG